MVAKSKLENDLKGFFIKYNNEFVGPAIKYIMENVIKEPPPNILVPASVWKDSVKAELENYFNAVDINTRIESGWKAIQEDMNTHLSAVEKENFKQEFKKGVDNLLKKITDKKEVTVNAKDFELKPITLFELMELPEKTFESLYAIGERLYSNKLYSQAGDVFFVINMLDSRRFNVWLAYGMCEQHLERIENALSAFAMASITNIESPLPYIHSAQCCIGISEFSEAKAYLKLAGDALKAHDPNNKQLKDYIVRLESNC